MPSLHTATVTHLSSLADEALDIMAQGLLHLHVTVVIPGTEFVYVPTAGTKNNVGMN